MVAMIQDEHQASLTGGWLQYNGLGYSSDLKYIAYNVTGSATWTFSGLANGNYRVYATWVEATNRTTAAPYTVQGQLVSVDQKVAPASDRTELNRPFKLLGVFAVTNGTLTVVLTNHSGGYVIADAVMIEEESAPPPPPPPPPLPARKIVWFGDSNLNGNFPEPMHAKFTARLMQHYSVTSVVAATGGVALIPDLAPGSPLYQQVIGATSPDYVVVNIGAKDALNGVSKADFKAALTATLAGIHAAKPAAGIVLCEMAEHTYQSPDQQIVQAIRDATRECGSLPGVLGVVPMADVVHQSPTFDGVHWNTDEYMANTAVDRLENGIVNGVFAPPLLPPPPPPPTGLDWTNHDAGVALVQQGLAKLAQFKAENQ